MGQGGLSSQHWWDISVVLPQGPASHQLPPVSATHNRPQDLVMGVANPPVAAIPPYEAPGPTSQDISVPGLTHHPAPELSVSSEPTDQRYPRRLNRGIPPGPTGPNRLRNIGRNCTRKKWLKSWTWGTVIMIKDWGKCSEWVGQMIEGE